MKHLVKVLILAVAVVGLTSGTALAQSIGNTGPGSDNSITNEDNSDTNIDNDNNVDVDLNCDQNAGSGDAEVSGNTTGGSAGSGNASNECDAEVDVSINNGCTTCPSEDDDDNGTTPTPGSDDNGNVLGAPNLPATAGTSSAGIAGTTAVVLGGIAVSTKLGVALARRFTL